ncbi:YdiU family protein [Vibrio hannami]|uniref:protein adenylyltransferase SelO n=1 Tax=Vibrio hannami TaxID=2717094 RepID=UPI00240F053D|nr:YdiU family protein [Vibrio hannami]MDG3087518.1 YdiU family protein [Vibrio hannami]
MHSYRKLGTEFFQQVDPEPVPGPELFLWNDPLAQSLSLPADLQNNASEYFSGNQRLYNSIPIAQAYAGHQFGHYNPQLGDGRAHLLGELEISSGGLVDIQLKGSGRTRFSRRGDGKCALGPAIREYVMSEALNALKVPTARTLAVVKTGESLLRTGPEPGAVVTRVASSHIRVGTFQYHAQSGNIDNLRRLTNYTIERHFPEIDTNAPDYVITFIRAVIAKQVTLITEWMRIGFIHGVMNTDNTAISGETIDYGPCAMVGSYDPRTVYSSIDTQGRYCFGNQPAIMQWNMTRFAESLLPLIASDTSSSVKVVEPLIDEITELYYSQFYQMMANKLGLREVDKEVTDQLLTIMETNKLDYTQTFIDLMHSVNEPGTINPELAGWHTHWLTRLDKISLERMKQANPLVIPRNHHVERVIEECITLDKPDSANELLSVLRHPYTMSENTRKYQDLPEDGDRYYQTFCGT